MSWHRHRELVYTRALPAIVAATPGDESCGLRAVHVLIRMVSIQIYIGSKFVYFQICQQKYTEKCSFVDIFLLIYCKVKVAGNNLFIMLFPAIVYFQQNCLLKWVATESGAERS